MKILVLGHKGLLGHMVLKYLSELTLHDCSILDKRYPTRSFRKYIENWDGDYIINCIGIIPQKTDINKKEKFYPNYLLPIWLDQHAKANIIHPGTDCEMDNNYYGISKKKASNWIKQYGKNTKIIKTSIIGFELNSKYSLMEWFLSQQKEVKGYNKFYWNGNTTLTWAEYALDIMENWNSYKTETILISKRISKYGLLNCLKILYNKDVKIIKDNSVKKDKCLYNGIETSHIYKQLKRMKKFYGKD